MVLRKRCYYYKREKLRNYLFAFCIDGWFQYVCCEAFVPHKHTHTEPTTFYCTALRLQIPNTNPLYSVCVLHIGKGSANLSKTLKEQKG